MRLRFRGSLKKLSPFGRFVGKSIRNQWQNFRRNVVIMVENGKKTTFWLDHWLDQLRTQHGWDLNFRRALNDWEIVRFPVYFRC
ncbi:hypothetical protein H5410_026688 [Solanum commersonii]|uniref:Uncharacterized protein n=1 Tax=Solanum commersonii TaxID=4109 RepID=A0A9J5Z1D4_SOLCO|nr:hypothetical protein H5410_026688 [Solanum commersonii]